MEKTEEELQIEQEAQKVIAEGLEALKMLQTLMDKEKDFKLALTLVCKNEESIIEENIKFHKAMGVDNIIVLNHNSTDNTLKILERLKEEGFVDEIITKTCPQHEHNIWVQEMVTLAREKYKAAWVINADADEFYFSKSLNLKKSIQAANDANVIKCYLTDLYPDDRDDFLSCPYFITRLFYKHELGMLNFENADNIVKEFTYTKTPKVINKTEGIKKMYAGNHAIDMENQKEIETSDITLYHFNIRNYKQFETRIKRWLEAINYMPGMMGIHMKQQIEIYKAGKLKEHYYSKYNEEKRKHLMENGIVTMDTSLSHFLKYKGII